MSNTWSVNLEELPRELNRPEFHDPSLVRKGDLWHNPSQGQHDKLFVDTVTKYVDPDYESIWYIITFEQESYLKALNIGEGMGLGTFYVGSNV